MRQLLRTMTKVVILVAGSLGPVVGQASEPPLGPAAEVIDLGNASVRFQVKLFGLARIVGHFDRLNGKLVKSDDRQTGSARMRIDVSSVNTNDDWRDELLRGPTFFDAERYPQITFSSSRLILGGNGPEQIVGDLSLHGTTRSVVFDVAPVGRAHIYDVDSYQAIATIKRSDFGLDSLRPIVSDEVEIIVVMRTN